MYSFTKFLQLLMFAYLAGNMVYNQSQPKLFHKLV